MTDAARLLLSPGSAEAPPDILILHNSGFRAVLTFRMPVLKALAAQALALLATLAIARSGFLPPLDLLVLACLQGGLAAFMSAWLRAARWWLPIHLGFLPAVVMASSAALPPWVYLAGFLVLWLVFWTSFRTQVPLFLSNRITVHRLAHWLPDAGCLRVADLGSGTGSFIAHLARLRPDWQVEGVESAPLPFLLSRWRTRKQSNAVTLHGDLWSYPLGDADVVYAFLSPVPMADLWRKARREMKPGSWLISNSFEVPAMEATDVIRVGDRRDTHLYCYRIPGGTRSSANAKAIGRQAEPA